MTVEKKYFSQGDVHLIQTDENFYIQFCEMKISVLSRERVGVGGPSDLLFKAIGRKKRKKNTSQQGRARTALDLTAGLGRDALHMAGLGLETTALERNSFLFKTLSAVIKSSRDELIQSLNIKNVEAYQFLTTVTKGYDIIFYDPLFPDKKKSAAVKKESQLLQYLCSEQVDSVEQQAAIIELAIQKAYERVIVKRPSHSPALKKPSYSIEGKAIRYDIYLAGFGA